MKQEPLNCLQIRQPRASFSECMVHEETCPPACTGRAYRFALWWPTGLENERICLGVFANPSTATAETLDPTLTRWRNYCRDWGFGWAVTANVRAWRATDPKDVPCDPIAIGKGNDDTIAWLAKVAELVVCGWGKLGGARGPVAIDLIRNAGKVPHALKLNKDGSPAHPLYLGAARKPFPMEAKCQ